MKKWQTNYSGHLIEVENRWNGERLIVNRELQDEQLGLVLRANLQGQLPTGEQIKVSLGGTFRIHCRIFVDNQLVLSE